MNILTEEHKTEHSSKEQHKPPHKEEHKTEVKNMEDHKKEDKHEHHKTEHKHVEHKHEVHKKIKVKKTDMWKILTLILGVLFIVSIFTNGFSGKSTSSGAVDKDKAANDAVEYINTYLMQGAGSAELKEVKEEGNLYVVKMSINGQEYDSYITNDGKYLFPQGIDVSKTPEVPETPTQPVVEVTEKKDVPDVEVFVMSHCPYGTQMEKGIIPVMETLGDKANIQIKFVNYAMHGEKEVLEQLNQYCIDKEQNDKFLPYLKCFLKEGKGDECLTEVGVDTAALETCKAAADEEFAIMENLEDKEKWSGGRFPPFLIHDAENKEYGISGSPSLAINGQNVNSGRDSASLLKTICGAFNEAPEECDTVLSSASPSPGFGFETTGSSTNAQC